MEIGVTYATLEHLEERCNQLSVKITQRVSNLDAELVPLSQTWTGTAQEAYKRDQVKWDQASADLTGVLTQIANTLGEILAAYRKTESVNTDMFS